MKIAIVIPSFSFLDGIWRNNVNMKVGFEKLGHTCDIYIVVHSKKSVPAFTNFLEIGEGNANKHEYGKQQYEVPFTTVGYNSDALLSSYNAQMEKYDFVIFADTPRMKKAFNTTDWNQYKQIYNLNAKMAIEFHDTSIDSKYSYSWIKDVASKITLALPCQHKSLYSSEQSGIARQYLYGLPVDLNKYPPYKDVRKLKEKSAISNHSFKAWKRIDLSIKAAPLMKACHLNVTSSGLLYYYFRQEAWWKEGEGKTFSYFGRLPRSMLEELQRKQMVVVDVSMYERFKHISKLMSYNYSLLEGILNWCVPVCSFPAIQHPLKESDLIVIPEGSDRAMSKAIAEACDKAVTNYDTYEEMLATSWQKIANKFADTKVCQNVITSLESDELLQKEKLFFGKKNLAKWI